MKAKKPKHIAVAGNIGAGKTTLTQQLSKHYKWIPHFEDVDHNPYLNDFYEDMPRWSFQLQIYFLNSRLRQLVEIQKGTETVIQDRTIYEDANIFAPNLHEMGLMSKRDFDNYFQFFQTLKTLVQPPDLLIYLNASVPTLVGNIQKPAFIEPHHLWGWNIRWPFRHSHAYVPVQSRFNFSPVPDRATKAGLRIPGQQRK